jgi:hypothetical protein
MNTAAVGAAWSLLASMANGHDVLHLHSVANVFISAVTVDVVGVAVSLPTAGR